MFLDFARIIVKAGNGGKGCVSFRREKFVAKGGPDGGNGGKGGDIIIVGNENINTLINFRYTKLFKAEDGKNGSGSNRTGRTGKSTIIEVPKGTEVWNISGGQRTRICDVTEQDKEYIICEGGNGGRGNACFASSTRQAPRFSKPGQETEQVQLELVLKLMADIGLVGFPNAGKSTLLSTISAARPKVADYAFTTLEPSLGVVHMQNYKSFVVADIPGIIEGAHDGKGLGIQFLKHIQRTRILLFLIDVNSETPLLDFETLRSELHQYDEALDSKLHYVAFSKTDTLDEESLNEKEKVLTEMFREKFKENILFVSSVTGKNIDVLKNKLYQLVEAYEGTN